MAIHKILIDDLLSSDYELIAIHSNLEDYRLAYLINKVLEIKLTKNDFDVELKSKDGKSIFEHFIFDDELQDLCWHLVSNKSNYISKNSNLGLFDDVNATMSLIPEFKTADYILKIDNTDDYFEPEIILKKLNEITNVSLVYKIEQNKLKSKNNLIF
ncbi:IPExxxVDY family protein [Flavobacterium haoranii]|uniref:IPExxxVDY family protein n=1 Tax=Flavobacterium haoranii TaxID=683124 RepID=A0A1M6E766_9FLAO|nr:IPExxxVDY family protein [Flavobacterium haoranii]SHI81275.1 hypothetical protein SAMN05444337_0865 [Flavobacterium haoranii]